MSCWLLAAWFTPALAGPLLEYDPGTAGVVGADRPFVDAESCVAEAPCTLNQYGALRPHTDGAADRVQLWLAHGNDIASFDHVR